MTFAGGEAQTESDEASSVATEERESDALEASQDLALEPDQSANALEEQAAANEADREEFTPTMTGAFLASDFAALLSSSPEKAKVDDGIAGIAPEAVQLDSLAEVTQVSDGLSEDIGDLEGGTSNQELALLQAEGFVLFKKRSRPQKFKHRRTSPAKKHRNSSALIARLKST